MIVRCFWVIRRAASGAVRRPVRVIRRAVVASVATPARVALVCVTVGAPLAVLPPVLLAPGGSAGEAALPPWPGVASDRAAASGEFGGTTGTGHGLGLEAVVGLADIRRTEPPMVVPEPSALLLLGAAVAGLWIVRRRRA